MLVKLTAKKFSTDVVEAFRLRLRNEIYASHINCVRAILFGSASQENEMTDTSDLDVLITFPDLESLKSGRKNLTTLSQRLEWPVDKVLMLEEDYLKQSEIGGVPFIAREEGLELFYVTST